MGQERLVSLKCASHLGSDSFNAYKVVFKLTILAARQVPTSGIHPELSPSLLKALLYPLDAEIFDREW